MTTKESNVKKNHNGRLKSVMHNVEALQNAIAYCGGKRSELANRLGVSLQTVEYWLHETNCITAERAMRIEYVTNGAVTRQEIRPDLYEPISERYDEVGEG